MRISKEVEGRKCPKCNRVTGQVNSGYNRFGTQRCICKSCKYKYTHNPKTLAYPEEVRKLAIKEYYSGVSARVVGKIHGMHHSMY